MEQLLKIEQVVELTGLRRDRIYKLIRDDHFPGVVRFGRQIRFNRVKIEAYIQGGGESLAESRQRTIKNP